MCGRYTLFTDPERLRERFDAEPDRPLEPRYNCAPGQELPVITNDAPDRMQFFTWGLTPEWADEKMGLINARAETVDRKRSFADAYASRRCLVPVDGFYEWVDRGESEERGKQPYRVAFQDDRPFAVAGLWERWEEPTRQTGLAEFGSDAASEESSVRETFTIVTTEPNDLIADLHHRMAVILPPERESEWLHGDPEAVSELLEPYPDDELTRYRVSERVNSPANDDPSLVDPVSG
ncbi:MAG: SOS response-associated peptidase, partial [Halohasta sp.]